MRICKSYALVTASTAVEMPHIQATTASISVPRGQLLMQQPCTRWALMSHVTASALNVSRCQDTTELTASISAELVRLRSEKLERKKKEVN